MLLGEYGTLERIYENIDKLPTKMQEILKAERENAFLSQKLATIVTDLDIDEHVFEHFREKLEKSEYIELLKKYEFRSLLPRDAMLTQKVSLDIEVQDIETLGQLEHLLSDMRQTPTEAVILSASLDKNIVFSYKNKISRIDPSRVDCREFATLILEGPNQVVGFDVKADLKRLLGIKNPQRIGEEVGQGSLF
jgi:hypothetical protein